MSHKKLHAFFSKKIEFNFLLLKKISPYTQSPIQMSKVKFSPCSKRYDGSSPKQDCLYSLIGYYYGISEKNIKKIGMTSEEIEEIIALYVKIRKTTEGLSPYLRKWIKSKKISSDKVLPLRTIQDLQSYDYRTILSAIENLKWAVGNAMCKTKEKLVDQQEELKNPLKHREKDEEWERTCRLAECYDRRCCLDKKAARKRAYKTSLIKSGSRDYSLMLSIDNIDMITRLIYLLEKSVTPIVVEDTVLS